MPPRVGFDPRAQFIDQPDLHLLPAPILQSDLFTITFNDPGLGCARRRMGRNYALFTSGTLSLLPVPGLPSNLFGHAALSFRG